MSQQTIVNVFETTFVTKIKKENNFVTKEEKQLCCSFLHVSQDPTTGTDLRWIAFWDQIYEQYNQNQHVCGVEWPTRSLEIKWGVIKHDVTKFIGHYKIVKALCESRTLVENILQKNWNCTNQNT
jgi:hypothetical protein